MYLKLFICYQLFPISFATDQELVNSVLNLKKTVEQWTYFEIYTMFVPINVQVSVFFVTDIMVNVGRCSLMSADSTN